VGASHEREICLEVSEAGVLEVSEAGVLEVSEAGVLEVSEAGVLEVSEAGVLAPGRTALGRERRADPNRLDLQRVHDQPRSWLCSRRLRG
jgi:hypothetical protein